MSKLQVFATGLSVGVALAVAALYCYHLVES